jgi:hypothetical protein
MAELGRKRNGCFGAREGSGRPFVSAKERIEALSAALTTPPGRKQRNSVRCFDGIHSKIADTPAADLTAVAWS